MGKEMSRPSWTELPPELLTDISKRLSSLADYLRFRAVCPSWRSATPHRNLRPFLPWLLLPSPPDAGLVHFFSPFERRFYSLHLPETRGKLCRGSSHGWLFLLGRSPEVILFNPITRARIDLPPLTTIPHVRGFEPWRTGCEYLLRSPLGGEPYTLRSETVRDSYIAKALLSSNPALDQGCIVVAVCAFRLKLALCRVGASSWTEVDLSATVGTVSDVTYYKGRFYVLGCAGRVAVCDVAGDSVDVALVPRIKIPVMEGGKMLLQDDGYLVELDGQLLAVIRRRSEGLVCAWDQWFSNYTESVSLFSLELGKKPRKVVIESIGDAILFVSQVAAVSALAADLPGCGADCIYFTDAYVVGSEMSEENGHGFCVLHLEGGVFERLLCDLGRFQQNLPPPIWFTPSLS